MTSNNFQTSAPSEMYSDMPLNSDRGGKGMDSDRVLYDFYSGSVPGMMDDQGKIWGHKNIVAPELTVPKDHDKKIQGLGLVTFGTSYVFRFKQFLHDS